MLLKELAAGREDIANAMMFCLDRADAAEEVVGHVSDSFSSLQTSLQKKAVCFHISLYKTRVTQKRCKATITRSY